MPNARSGLCLLLGAVFAIAAFAFSSASSRADGACDAVLQPVNDLLQKAEADIARRDVKSGGTLYDAAMSQLANVPWSPTENTCDANRYRFEKFLVTVRSLIVAIKLNRIAPQAALTLDSNLLSQIYSLTGDKAPATISGTSIATSPGSPPGSETVTVTRAASPNTSAAAKYYHDRYPDLNNEYGNYYREIADLGQQRRIALHNPTSAACSNPNIEAEPLAREVTGVTTLLMSPYRRVTYGTYAASVEVKLAADGTVEAANLKESSGNQYFDDAVLKDAGKTKYLPAVANCKQIPSIYIFSTTEKIL